MNETVARIVELLFEDLEMTSEVQAMHDEVMDNCQERFGDLVAHGLTEDEAIGAVVESLKGMEDVLKNYPRKAKEPEPDKDEEEDTVVRKTYSAESVRRIDVSVVSEDVTIEPSADDQVHVETVSEKKRLVTELEDGTLCVRRLPQTDEKTGDKSGNKDVKIVINDGDVTINGNSIRQQLGRFFRFGNLTINFPSDGGDRVTIQVPVSVPLESARVHTTIGDVGVNGLHINEMDVNTTSGDLRVEQASEHPFSRAQLHTTSGDVQTDFMAEHAEVVTMSGDVSMRGDVRTLTVRTTSGDLTVGTDGDTCEVRSVSGDMRLQGAYRAVNLTTTSGDVNGSIGGEQWNFNTVSGDIAVNVKTQGPCRISGHSVSGDMTFTTPDSCQEADVRFQSVSGDQHLYRGVRNVPDAALKLSVSSVSGDLTVR